MPLVNNPAIRCTAPSVRGASGDAVRYGGHQSRRLSVKLGWRLCVGVIAFGYGSALLAQDAALAGSRSLLATLAWQPSINIQQLLDHSLSGTLDRTLDQALDRALLGMRRWSAYSSFSLVDAGDSAASAPVGTGGVETSVEERRPLNASGTLRIRNVAGSVEVRTWSRNEVSISGELGPGVEKLELGGDSSQLTVDVRVAHGSHARADSDLQLRVPVAAHVQIETVSASVSAHDLAGPITVNTVSGDVALHVASTEVAVQTVSGDLMVNAPAQQTRINSVSGDVKLSQVREDINVETVSGKVVLDGGRFSRMHLKSISGDLEVSASFAPQAQVSGETLSGNIALAVPSNVSGMAKIKTFSGDALCDGGKTAGLPRNEYQLGNGSGVSLELSSFSGDIRLRKH